MCAIFLQFQAYHHRIRDQYWKSFIQFDLVCICAQIPLILKVLVVEGDVKANLTFSICGAIPNYTPVF